MHGHQGHAVCRLVEIVQIGIESHIGEISLQGMVSAFILVGDHRGSDLSHVLRPGLILHGLLLFQNTDISRFLQKLIQDLQCRMVSGKFLQRDHDLGKQAQFLHASLQIRIGRCVLYDIEHGTAVFL